MRNDQLLWNPPPVIAGAGVKLGQLIAGAAQHGLGGLAWLIGVPGSVGGAVYGNAGSRTAALGDYVEWVEGYLPDGSARRWTKGESEFSYRTSRFKNQPAIILQVQLQLPTVDVATERAALAATAARKKTVQPLTDASAGCMFKNPVVDPSSLPDDLRSEVFPDGTLSAWRLIAAAGLQGRRLGQMEISPRHANFMINHGGATADQAVQLISLVKQQVRDKLGVQLHEEVQYLGF